MRDTEPSRDRAGVFRPSKRPTLDQAQACVGGYVQLLYLTENKQMLINEEGSENAALLPNPVATELARSSGYLVSRAGIRGNVMVLEGAAQWID